MTASGSSMSTEKMIALYRQGWSLKRIGEAAGITHGAVQHRLARAEVDRRPSNAPRPVEKHAVVRVLSVATQPLPLEVLSKVAKMTPDSVKVAIARLRKRGVNIDFVRRGEVRGYQLAAGGLGDGKGSGDRRGQGSEALSVRDDGA